MKHIATYLSNQLGAAAHEIQLIVVAHLDEARVAPHGYVALLMHSDSRAIVEFPRKWPGEKAKTVPCEAWGETPDQALEMLDMTVEVWGPKS